MFSLKLFLISFTKAFLRQEELLCHLKPLGVHILYHNSFLSKGKKYGYESLKEFKLTPESLT